MGICVINREQRVVVNGSYSNPVSVNSGVPQGTALGPLLFLLHINDLPQMVSSQTRLCADDCLLYRPIRSRDDQVLMQRDLDTLQEWGNTWGMRFHPSKCNIMRISRSREHITQFYSLGGQVLVEVQLHISRTKHQKWAGMVYSHSRYYTKREWHSWLPTS